MVDKERLKIHTHAIVCAYCHVVAEKINSADYLQKFLEIPNEPSDLPHGPQIVNTINSLIEELSGDFQKVVNIDTIHYTSDVSWGRIISMFVLLKQVVEHLIEDDKASFVPSLISHTEKFIDNVVSPFVLKEGGWVGLLEYCKNKNQPVPQSAVILKGVTSLIGFMGIVVLFNLILRKI